MISVVVALYNGSEYIDKTIESVLNQEYKDFELIIVDDCSRDNSVEKVQKWVERDSRIMLVKNTINLGFCKTVNNGVKKSKGEYILVLGQDDMLDTNHFNKMISIIEKHDVAVVYCDYTCIDEEDNVVDSSRHCKQTELVVMDFLERNAMPSCGAIQKRVFFDKAGGYPELEEFPQYGEWYLWIKMLEYGRIVFCKDVRSLYRRHKDNMTNGFKNIETQEKLERYWNICRELILSNKEVTNLRKIRVKSYIVYSKIRFKLKLFIYRYR